MLSPIEIFCCYAHKDRSLLQELLNHLTPLEQQELIQIWSDHDINAGVGWEREIEKHLEASQIVLLLVSSDFLASKYIYSKEMKRAMERHEQNEARVIPILLRHVNWEDAPFAKLQILPTGAKPVSSWSDKDEAFTDITKQISTVVKELRLAPKPDDVQEMLNDNTNLSDGTAGVINDVPTVRRIQRMLPNPSNTVQPSQSYSSGLQRGQPTKSNEDINKLFEDFPSPKAARPQKQIQAPIQRRTASPRQSYRLPLDSDDIVDESLYATPRKANNFQTTKNSESSIEFGEILGFIIIAIVALVALAMVIGIPILLANIFRFPLSLLFVIMCIGIFTGILVGFVTRGRGYGVVGDVVMGYIGALAGWFVTNLVFHIPNYWFDGMGAFIGAYILISILRAFAYRSMRRRV